MGRPSSAARAFAPNTTYCDARGPAPQEMYSRMNAGASASAGRVIRTSVTAACTSARLTGIRRTRCCNASTSSAVSTTDTVAATSPVVASTIASSSAFDGYGTLSSKAERSEEHTSELQSLAYLVCRLLLEKKKKQKRATNRTTKHLRHRQQREVYAQQQLRRSRRK